MSGTTRGMGSFPAKPTRTLELESDTIRRRCSTLSRRTAWRPKILTSLRTPWPGSMPTEPCGKRRRPRSGPEQGDDERKVESEELAPCKATRHLAPSPCTEHRPWAGRQELFIKVPPHHA